MGGRTVQFVFAIVAYVTAIAAGVHALSVATHELALSAAQNLKLPEPKPTNEPTLVERREIAQQTPVVAKPALRRVAALTPPKVPLALLASKLDDAETAYVPEVSRTVVLAYEHRMPVAAAKPLHHGKKLARVGKTRLAASTAKRGKQMARRDPFASGPVQLFAVRPANSARMATFETPGSLMFRGLLNRQS